jgi:hypothetical protein
MSKRVFAMLINIAILLTLLTGCGDTDGNMPNPIPMTPMDFGLPAIDRQTIIDDYRLSAVVNSSSNTQHSTENKGSVVGSTYVVFDDSGSVRNYLQDKSGSSAYMDFINGVFDSVENAQYYTLCQGAGKPQNDIIALKNNLKLPEFYNLDSSQYYTPLYTFLADFFSSSEVIDSIESNLYVILSDMFISGEVDATGVPENLANLIDEYFLSAEYANQTTVGIIGVKMGFRGNYSDMPKLNIATNGVFDSNNIIAPSNSTDALPSVRSVYVNGGNAVLRPYYAILLGNENKVNKFIHNMESLLSSNSLFEENFNSVVLDSVPRALQVEEKPPLLVNSKFDLPTLEGGELSIRETGLSLSGILTKDLSGDMKNRANDIEYNDLITQNTNVLLINQKVDEIDWETDTKICVPLPEEGNWAVVETSDFRLETNKPENDSISPSTGETSLADGLETIKQTSSELLIDFGVNGKDYMFGVEGAFSLDDPVLYKIVLSSSQKATPITHTVQPLPAWLHSWQLDLGAYKDEAYRLVGEDYEFILDGTHSLRDIKFTQYEKTPFVYELFSSLHKRRINYINSVTTLLNANARVQNTTIITYFGIVERKAYALYLTSGKFKIKTEIAKDYYTDDGGFAFKFTSVKDAVENNQAPLSSPNKMEGPK